MRISFLGDILVYEQQNKWSRIGPNKYDYTDYLELVKPLLKDSDYVVGSLETPLAGKRAKYTYEDVSFNTPDDILSTLKDIGVNMLTTGNNHALDRGIDGLLRTIRVLKRYGFDYTGTNESPSDKRYVIKEIEGVKIAFLSYTYGTNSAYNEHILAKDEEYLVNLTKRQELPPNRSFVKRLALKVFPLLPKKLRNIIRPVSVTRVIEDCVEDFEIANVANQKYIDDLKNTIKEARRESDIVIFCLHSGGQFNNKVSGYTKWLIDLIVSFGVNAVICNHTHTVLPIEWARNGCLVAYSLGNFAFTPKTGCYVDNVGAEYSKILHLEIDSSNKSIIDFSTSDCVSIVDESGRTRVMPTIGNVDI